MAEWDIDSGQYAAFNLRGSESRYYAFGARDGLGEERPQIVLIQQPGNKGPNLETTEGRALCIDDFSKKAGMSCQDFDWFHLDQDGKTRAIDIQLRPEKVTNPKFEELKQGDGILDQDHDAALRAFPPITVQRTETTERGLTKEEMSRLQEAFPDGFDMRPFEQPEIDEALRGQEPAPDDRGLADTSFSGNRDVEDLNPAHIKAMEPDDGFDL